MMPKDKPSGWSPDEVAALRDARDRGMKPKQIAHQVKSLRDRSPAAIKHKFHELAQDERRKGDVE